MPIINLKAQLKAYSKAPFYEDWVRDASSNTIDGYDPSILYVRQNGEWVPFDESIFGIPIEEIQQNILSIKKEIDNANIGFNNLGIVFNPVTDSLYFINRYGVLSDPIALPSAKVDKITVGLNDKNQVKILDTPDEISIKVVDVQYSEEHPEESFTSQKLSGKLRAESLYSEKDPTLNMIPEEIAEFNKKYISGYSIKERLKRAEEYIKELRDHVQGTGGFLTAYNFGRSLAAMENKNERNYLLDQYAYSQLFDGEIKQIPDQTKVKNIYTGNIWVYVLNDDTWINEGQDTIVAATNDGVFGSVTGTEYNPEDPSTKFKISIGKDNNGLSTGIMSVNGIEDEFDKVIYKKDLDLNFDVDSPIKLAQRNERGALTTAESEEDDEAINQGQFNAWVSEVTISEEAMNELLDEWFPEIAISGGGL